MTNCIKFIILVVILMGTSNCPSLDEAKLALQISSLEETSKVENFWEQVNHQQQQQYNEEIRKLIFEINLVHSKNNFLQQSNAVLHDQIVDLEQTIQIQNIELNNKEIKIKQLQNSTKSSPSTPSPTLSPSSTNTSSSSTYTSSQSQSQSPPQPPPSSSSHLKDVIDTVGTFILDIGEGLQAMWNEVSTIIKAPFTPTKPQSRYIHITPEDQSLSFPYVRSCVANYTVSSGGIINDTNNEIINQTAMKIIYAFTDAKIQKKRSTPLLISGNNKTNINELWNCLSRMEKYGRQLRLSSNTSRTEFTEEIFQEISNRQTDKLPRTIVVVDIDETVPTYNNTGETAAYRGHLEGAIDDTMPIFTDTKQRQVRSDNVFFVMLLKTNLDLNGDYEENLLCMREYFMEQWTFRFWARLVHQIFLPH
eukprot:TRINITY_DN6852_c0_g1_i3.p1 TRINITY_DN6852_c0_g1~~TRINITY_DN6852_c0_g1_i3.p1  ORF type:complete len:420 (-),score=86.89 TRINITY_DN6852_c0_g1_i3:164-1423(-)